MEANSAGDVPEEVKGSLNTLFSLDQARANLLKAEFEMICVRE